MSQVVLSNGRKCPVLGLGTYLSLKDECYQITKFAIDIGYRHFDTALFYQNEEELGRALNEKIRDKVVTREDLFVTTKLWNTFHEPAMVRPAFDSSLKKLGLDYVDLYLMHWPMSYKCGWDDLIPSNAAGQVIPGTGDFVDTWKEMEKLVREGLVKSIGISNFNKAQTLRLLKSAEIRPVVNQIESHPYLPLTEFIEFSRAQGIHVTAYRPFGAHGDGSVLLDPTVAAIARKYGKTPAQILIRFHIDRGVSVIPKSVTPNRVASNFDVFDFKLSSEDMNLLLSLNKGKAGRCIPATEASTHPDYPFNDEW